MNKTKFTALLLLLALLAPTALLTSCSGGSSSGIAETSSDSGASDTEAAETASSETTALTDGLPDTDLGGWEMRVLSHHDALSDESTITATELNGEIINDIIYTRNSSLENRFNFVYTVYPGSGWADDYNKLKTSVLAGSRDYDMSFLLPFASSGNTVLDECLYNMLSVPNLNFDQPWWHTSVNELFTYDGYLPFVSSDFLLSSYQYANILIFNKTMAENNDLPSIYDMVRGGTWTLDSFRSLTSAVKSDLNGDGEMTVDDQYGLSTNFGYHAITWGYAIGEVSVKLDAANETVTLGYQDEKFYSLCEWLYNLLYVSDEAFEIGWDKECDIKWDENRTLMQALWVNDLEKFRGCESEYGIIPYPKYDEAQEEYKTYVDARSGGCAIPMDADKETIANVGLVLEAMSCASYNDLIPAYLESVTNGKLVRDDDSIEMLNIIASGRVWDIGYTMSDTSSYTWIIFTDLKKSGGQVASSLEKKTEKTINHYNSIIEAYKELAAMDWQ